MHPFTLERPRDVAAALALRAHAGRNDAPVEYIAGGTDMVQLLQEYVRQPNVLVSLRGVVDTGIDMGPSGLRIGAARRWPTWRYIRTSCSNSRSFPKPCWLPRVRKFV